MADNRVISDIDGPTGNAVRGVVVLGDDEAERSSLGRLLTKEPGFWVRPVADLDSLASLCDIEVPAVVVCVPSSGRLAALRWAARLNRRLPRALPVVMVCSEVPPDLQERLAAFGADWVIPVEQAEEKLAETVRMAAAGDGPVAGIEYQPGDLAEDPARVLMIDDSRAVCMAVECRMQAERQTVFASVNDPQEALQKAQDFEPTVILLDLEMPHLSGFDVLDLLRSDQQTRAIPIIMLSGTTDPAVKANAFMHGADDYAEKVMDTVELNSRIAYHTRAYRNHLRLEQTIRQLSEATVRLEVQRDFIRSTFGRYLSDEVVDTLLESQGLELGGERRTVSIMMADLRGFTSMCEGLEPEDTLAIVNNFLAVMTEILLRHHGTIDEFIGDAILAIFGAPILRPDDAKRAVACALDMQLAMAKVNDWNRQAGFPELGMGVGINTGDVVVGNIGSEKRSKYGVVGSQVNLTSRIESATSARQILVSKSTLEACGDILRIDDEFEIHPKGFDQAITVYLIGGISGGFDVEV